MINGNLQQFWFNACSRIILGLFVVNVYGVSVSAEIPNISGGSAPSDMSFDGENVCFDYTDLNGGRVSGYCTNGWSGSVQRMINFIDGLTTDSPFWSTYYAMQGHQVITISYVKQSLEALTRFQGQDKFAWCDTLQREANFSHMYTHRGVYTCENGQSTCYEIWEPTNNGAVLQDICSVDHRQFKGDGWTYDGRHTEESPDDFEGTCDFSLRYEAEYICPKFMISIDQMRIDISVDTVSSGQADVLIGMLVPIIDYDTLSSPNFFETFLIDYTCPAGDEVCDYVPPPTGPTPDYESDYVPTASPFQSVTTEGTGDDAGTSTTNGTIEFPCNPLFEQCDDDIPNNAGEEISEFEDEDAETFVDIRHEILNVLDNPSDACPVPVAIQAPIFQGETIEMKFDFICEAIDYVRPLMMLLAAYLSMSIVMGGFKN